MCAKDALGVDDDANNGAKARAWARNTRRPGEGRHARFGVLDEGSVSWLVNNSRVPTKFCSCRRAQRVRLGLRPLRNGARAFVALWFPRRRVREREVSFAFVLRSTSG